MESSALFVHDIRYGLTRGQPHRESFRAHRSSDMRAWRRLSGDIRCVRSVHRDRAQMGSYARDRTEPEKHKETEMANLGTVMVFMAIVYYVVRVRRHPDETTNPEP
jgi:hypothetical protein